MRAVSAAAGPFWASGAQGRAQAAALERVFVRAVAADAALQEGRVGAAGRRRADEVAPLSPVAVLSAVARVGQLARALAALEGALAGGVDGPEIAAHEGAAGRGREAAGAARFALALRLRQVAGSLTRAAGPAESTAAAAGDALRRLSKSVSASVFLLAAAVAPSVRRSALMPSYRGELRSALALRAGWRRLRGQLDGRSAALAALSDDALAASASTWGGEMMRQLAAFADGAAARGLRRDDQRGLAGLRARLAAAGAGGHCGDGGRLRREVATLQTFVQALAAINHRESLVVHDRMVLQRAQLALRAASAAAGSAVARRQLATALALVGRAGGRSAELDAVWRAAMRPARATARAGEASEGAGGATGGVRARSEAWEAELAAWRAQIAAALERLSPQPAGGAVDAPSQQREQDGAGGQSLTEPQIDPY